MGLLNSALNAGLAAANQAVKTVKNSNTASTSSPNNWGGSQVGNALDSATNQITDYVNQTKTGNELPQPAVAGIPQTTPQVDIAARMQQMADAQKASQIAGLDKSRSNALASLNTEQSNLNPMYYDKRNQAAASSDVGALNFAQYMAARGIKGNAGAMPEIYRNAGLQGQIGALDQQQAQANAGIESQRGLVNTNYASDVASANAGVDAQTMAAQIAQYNTDNQYKLQQDQLAMQKQQADAQNTGYYNPYAGNTLTPEIQAQLAPYANDLQAYIDANPNGALTPYAQNERYQKVMGDQTARNQYGQQYQTVAGMNASLQNQGQELDNKAKEILNSTLPETYKLQTQKLMQDVKTGALSYPQALANMNQTLAQTDAIRAGVATNAFNAQTDAVYKQGMLANNANKTDASLTTAKSDAYKYFDSIKLSDGNPVGATQASNLKQDFDAALSDALQQADPLNAVIQNKQALIDKFGPWGGPLVVTALENALRTYSPK